MNNLGISFASYQYDTKHLSIQNIPILYKAIVTIHLTYSFELYNRTRKTITYS